MITLLQCAAMKLASRPNAIVQATDLALQAAMLYDGLQRATPELAPEA